MRTIYAALDDRLLSISGEQGDWSRHRRLDSMDLECVAASPADPQRAFAGTVHAGLQRSEDGGDTWAAIGGFEERDERVTILLVSSHDADTVYAGTEPSRVYRSRDGGDTWAHRPGLTSLPSSSRWSFPPRPSTHHVRWLAESPAVAGVLYVGIEAGAIVRSPDGGATWQDHPEGAPRDPHTIRLHRNRPQRVAVAAGDGYAESPDGGDTWEFRTDGLDHRYVWGMVVDPGDASNRLAGAASSARRAHTLESADTTVYRREADTQWERAQAGLGPSDGQVRPVFATNETPSRAYALTNRGLFRTDDWGGSWEESAAIPAETCAGRMPQGLAVV